MIERLFFDGIDGETGGCAIAERIENSADVFPNITETSLAVADTTEARAKGAEYLPIGLRMPPEGFFHKENIPLLRRRGKGMKLATGSVFSQCVL
jgi:hypothetical protein